MRLSVPFVAFALVACAAYAPGPGQAAASRAAADSTEWENLQVLPDSLSRDELIGVMRTFTDALGVRCDHCHAREGGDLVFPSDANPHKEVARGMMRMTWQINEEILPAIDGLHEAEGLRVTCVTCHRGEPRPATSLSDEPTPPEHEHGDHEHGDHEHGSHPHGESGGH